MRQFETAGCVRLQVRNRTGRVRVATHGQGSTEVEVRALAPASAEQAARTRVECAEISGEYRVTVDVPTLGPMGFVGGQGVEVVVRVPDGARLEVAGAACDVAAEGHYAGGSIESSSGDVLWEHVTGDAAIATSSGDVTVHRADAALTVETASGDVRVAVVSGRLRLETRSGDITVGQSQEECLLRGASSDVQVGIAAGPLAVQTASGDVTVGESHADCRLQSRSGDVEVGLARMGTLGIETMSGDVLVAIAPGSRVAVDAQTRSGALRSDIPLSDSPDGDRDKDVVPLVTLTAHTLSGDVRIVRARQRATGLA